MSASNGLEPFYPEELESDECWDAAKLSFSNTTQEALNCTICLGLLRDAVALRCGHTFGQRCIAKYMGTERQSCPDCRTESHMDHIGPIFSIRSLVDSADVSCGACGMAMRLGQLEDHWRSSCFRDCKYASLGCDARLQDEEAVAAHRQRCAFDPIAQQRRLNEVDTVLNKYKTALEDNMRHAWVADLKKARMRCTTCCTRAITMTTELDAVAMAPGGVEDEARRRKVHMLKNLEVLEKVMQQTNAQLEAAERVMTSAALHGLMGDWDAE